MRRRSVSSFVSPGPRVPMPPPSRDSAAPAPTSRGSRYFSCASSTCSLPSRVRARRAKMSRISCVRSTILRPTSSSICRSCAGVSSLSKMTTSTSVSAHGRGERLDLAGAEERRRIGLRPLLQHAQHDVARRPLRRGRRARRASARRRGAARGRRSARPAPRARAPATASVCAAMPEPRPMQSRPRARAPASAPVTSTIVDGGPPRRRPGVDQQINARSPSARSTSSGSAVGRLAADVRAGRGDRTARRPRTSRARRRCAARGRRRVPVPPVTSRASDARRGTSSVSGPGQNAPPGAAAIAGSRPRCAATCAASAATSGSARVGGAPLHREHARDGVGVENGSAASPYSVSVGIATTPPSRIHSRPPRSRRAAAHPGSTNTRRMSAFPIAARSASRDSSVIVQCTAAMPIDDESTMRTRLAPPTKPAMNGLLAMPTSDALVSTPKPAPWARGRNHRAGGAVSWRSSPRRCRGRAAATPRTSPRRRPRAPNRPDAGRRRSPRRRRSRRGRG